MEVSTYVGLWDIAVEDVLQVERGWRPASIVPR